MSSLGSKAGLRVREPMVRARRAATAGFATSGGKGMVMVGATPMPIATKASGITGVPSYRAVALTTVLSWMYRAWSL